MKKALITGVNGQDGSYLAELLLSKGYLVHGMKRKVSSLNTENINHLYQDPHEKNTNFKLHYGDLTDSSNITRIIQEVRPDEIYNLGAMSHVKVSFELPVYVATVDGLGALRILEAVRLLNLTNHTKIYQASTSELFGKVQTIPQTEDTQFYPRSPYGVAKLFAYWMIRNYREAYNMFAANGILFNHESPRRGETFVTRKITLAACRIFYGLQDKLFLGNLDAKRDWGHAKDYVEGMWKILQHDKPDDFVLATGETYSIRQFCKLAFSKLGIILDFIGSGKNEKGVVRLIERVGAAKSDVYKDKIKPGMVLIEVDPNYFRPTEVDLLIGNPSKANKILDWNPTHNLSLLINEMINSDFKIVQNEYLLKNKS